MTKLPLQDLDLLFFARIHANLIIQIFNEYTKLFLFKLTQ